MKKKTKRRPPRKPTQDELRQAIFDNGIGCTLRKYDLGEVSAGNILFGSDPKEGKNPNSPLSQSDEKYFELDSNSDEVKNSIEEHYNFFRKFFVKNQNSVDRYQGLTDEDRFHEALLTVLQTLDRFTFSSEQETRNYILTRLTIQKLIATQTLIRLRKEIKIQELKTEEIAVQDNELEKLRRKAKLAKFNVVIKKLKRA